MAAFLRRGAGAAILCGMYGIPRGRLGASCRGVSRCVYTALNLNFLAGADNETPDYIWLTLFTHHYVVVHGVRDVVARLSAPVPHIHTSSPIASIRSDPQEPGKVIITTNDGLQSYAGFTHVIFATQANSAVPILSSYLDSLAKSSVQRKQVEDILACLRTFRYCPTVVVNHTDDSLMPDNHADRRDLNLVNAFRPEAKEDSDICVDKSYTMATHVLSRHSSCDSSTPNVYQTTNPIIPPKKDSVLSVAQLERAVLTTEAKKALRGLAQEERTWWQAQGRGKMTLGSLQGAGKLSGKAVPGIWICGSYAHGGIPLLEGCAVSAKNVVDQGILRSEGLEPIVRPW